jgi:uncharacterized FlaG/YvyC family protein
MNGDLSITAQSAPLDLAPSVRRTLTGPAQPTSQGSVTQPPAGTASPLAVAPVGQQDQAARLKSLLTDPDVQVSTYLDDATGRFVLQVQSLSTGEVVEQIPSEELLGLYASIRESLVDERA